VDRVGFKAADSITPASVLEQRDGDSPSLIAVRSRSSFIIGQTLVVDLWHHNHLQKENLE
jgi:hypothetical protein